MKKSNYKKHSVEWTVREMIGSYPSLFQSRTQCLHHLFVVLGNGYKWVGGKLTCVFKGEKRKLLIPKNALNILADYRPKLSMFYRHPYPLLQECKLLTIPKNVEQDWEDAAFETINLVFDNAAERAKLRNTVKRRLV